VFGSQGQTVLQLGGSLLCQPPQEQGHVAAVACPVREPRLCQVCWEPKLGRSSLHPGILVQVHIAKPASPHHEPQRFPCPGPDAHTPRRVLHALLKVGFPTMGSDPVQGCSLRGVHERHQSLDNRGHILWCHYLAGRNDTVHALPQRPATGKAHALGQHETQEAMQGGISVMNIPPSSSARKHVASDDAFSGLVVATRRQLVPVTCIHAAAQMTCGGVGGR